MAISTITHPGLSDFSNFLEINFGAFAPAINTAPIIKSLLIASLSIVSLSDRRQLILPLK